MAYGQIFYTKYWIWVYSLFVHPKEELVRQLGDLGIIDSICWAYNSAVARALDDFSGPAGYTTTSLGIMRHDLFCDRLDRVFSCGKYTLGPGQAPHAGLDALTVELSDNDIETMPALDPVTTHRADVNRSPGWIVTDMNIRFLISSCDYSKLDSLPWHEKSPTKQQVAQQTVPPQEASLFDDLRVEDAGDIAILQNPEDELDVDTYIVAHTLEPSTERSELVFGMPNDSSMHGSAWHWRVDLVSTHSVSTLVSKLPESSDSDSTPDAPVRLRGQNERRDGDVGDISER